MKLIIILSAILIVSLGTANAQNENIQNELAILEKKLADLIERKIGLVKALDARIYLVQEKIAEKCNTGDCKKPILDSEPFEKGYKQALKDTQQGNQEAITNAYERGFADGEKSNTLKQVFITDNRVYQGLQQGRLAYHVEALPYYSNYNEIFIDYLFDELETDELVFDRVYDIEDADFTIEWIKDYGKETVGAVFGAKSATIGLGETNCIEQWQHFDSITINNIIVHEVGHILGFEHSNNPNNVMFESIDTRTIYESEMNDIIPSNWYFTYPFCSDGKYSYSFSTDENSSFEIYVLPEETDVDDFVNEDKGNYYTCEEPDTFWISKSNECIVDQGSKIMIFNNENFAIKVDGKIREINPHQDVEWIFDSENIYY